MNLNEWALKHHVSLEALVELKTMWIKESPAVGVDDIAGPEQMVSHSIRLQASEAGARLWRNNVGAGRLENGRFIRWGLCNDTPELNRKVKSADLIGLRPILISPAMVGQTIGQFVSREVKRRGWRYHDTEEERAQVRWMNIINAMGGDATITTGEF